MVLRGPICGPCEKSCRAAWPSGLVFVARRGIPQYNGKIAQLAACCERQSQEGKPLAASAINLEPIFTEARPPAMMKMSPRGVLPFLLLLSGLSVNLFAADDPAGALRQQIADCYNLYSADPEQSCDQLGQTLAASDISLLEPREAKEAYYFLANCQYQQQNLDQAVRTYAKVADLDPADHHPLIDAGSVYREQALYAQAQAEYRAALERVAGNTAEESRIRAMIKDLPNQLRQDYTFSTSIGYDSNVNSGPSDGTHLLYNNFNYTLGADEKSRDDLYTFNSLGAAFRKPLNPETNLLVNAGVSDIRYFTEEDFNSTTLYSSLGYQRGFGDKSVTLGPFVNYQTLDQASYLVNGGVGLSGAVRVSDRVDVWPYVGGYTQNFYKDDPRDAWGATLGTSASYKLRPETTLVISLFYTYNQADKDQYSYDNVFLGGSVYQTLSQSLSAALGYNLQLFYYGDRDPAFGVKREDDGHTVYLNLDYSLQRLLRLDRSFLSFNVSYNQNNSNHSFQDRDRVFSAVKFTIAF